MTKIKFKRQRGEYLVYLDSATAPMEFVGWVEKVNRPMNDQSRWFGKSNNGRRYFGPTRIYVAELISQ